MTDSVDRPFQVRQGRLSYLKAQLEIVRQEISARSKSKTPPGE